MSTLRRTSDMNYPDQNMLILATGLNYYSHHGKASRQILFSIDFNLRAGEIVIITGPSGSGKSTLLGLFGGLRTHQEGRLNVLGHEMLSSRRKSSDAIRKKVGFIFQEDNLLHSLTAIENVCVGFSTARQSRSQIYENATRLLWRLGLGSKIHSYPSQLSGGQKQRIAIARGLLRRPELILADEPTASLDADATRLVMELCRSEVNINRSGMILVTHDARIFNYASRIVEIKNGRQQNKQTSLLKSEGIEIQSVFTPRSAAHRHTTGNVALHQ